MNNQIIMPSYKDFCNAAKGRFIGEFKFYIDDRDENGEEHSREVTVPWTTIKEIYQLAVTEYGQTIPNQKDES